VVDQCALILKLALAGTLGGVVGFEREVHGQAAGLRTHMVLSLGAALAAELSILFSQELVEPGFSSDPARIVAQVVSGLGFLGAGAIVRYGASIKGLTTAASLWTTAIIGIACGSGFGGLAAASAAMVVTTLWAIGFLERRFLSAHRTHTVKFALEDRPGIVRDLRREVEALGVKVVSMSVSVSRAGAIKVTMVVNKPDDLTFDKLIGVARSTFGARAVKID
jgi:uncharacterized membrane protein YhiD involved in acid resistance